MLVKTSKKNFELSGHVFQSQKMFEMISFWFPNVCVLKSDKNVESFASYCRVLIKIRLSGDEPCCPVVGFQ